MSLTLPSRLSRYGPSKVAADHGHLDEGGHGGSTPEERNSFILRWQAGGSLTPWPRTVSPHELLELLLDESL
ncbi:hypothetical protein [Saccharopolyspora shandongensis]|uniref:hypothetical protein n=1 Tax=Saccharopolyspora shandongensis TaxID=418495 RepID=UPI0033BFD002